MCLYYDVERELSSIKDSGLNLTHLSSLEPHTLTMMLGFSDKEKGAQLKEIGLYPEAQEFDSEERKLKPTQTNVAGAGELRPGPGPLVHSRPAQALGLSLSCFLQRHSQLCHLICCEKNGNPTDVIFVFVILLPPQTLVFLREHLFFTRCSHPVPSPPSSG